MSYDNKDYRFGYSRVELERLGAQHRVWEEATQPQMLFTKA